MLSPDRRWGRCSGAVVIFPGWAHRGCGAVLVRVTAAVAPRRNRLLDRYPVAPAKDCRRLRKFVPSGWPGSPIRADRRLHGSRLARCRNRHGMAAGRGGPGHKSADGGFLSRTETIETEYILKDPVRSAHRSPIPLPGVAADRPDRRIVSLLSFRFPVIDVIITFPPGTRTLNPGFHPALISFSNVHRSSQR